MPDGVRLYDQGVRVAALGGGSKRVTGQVLLGRQGKVHSFTCLVSPDASDKLRGLKIDNLTVIPPTP